MPSLRKSKWGKNDNSCLSFEKSHPYMNSSIKAKEKNVFSKECIKLLH